MSDHVEALTQRVLRGEHSTITENAMGSQYRALANAWATMQTGDSQAVRDEARIMMMNLYAATPFAWHAEQSAELAAAAKALPMTAETPHELPEGCPICWFYFFPPYPLDISHPDEPQHEAGATYERDSIHALLLHRGQTDITALVYRRGTKPVGGGVLSVHIVPSIVVGFPVGRSIGTISGEAIRKLAVLVTAACAYLQEHVVEDHHVERHARKRLAREYKIDKPLLSSSVRVVTLRRLQSVPTAKGEPQETHRREPDHRWIVPQGMVHRWKGKGADKKLELVPRKAHPNGPKGKPLKATPVLYDVSR